MWIVTYKPGEKATTIGNVTAVWNQGEIDEFTYTGSVNMDSAGDVQNFIAVAQKYRAAHDDESKPIAIVNDALVAITAGLNK